MDNFGNIANELRAAAANVGKEQSRISLEVAIRMLASLKRRVFFKGLDGAETKIGNYSTKPMLVGSSSFLQNGSQVAGKSAVRSVFGSKKSRKSRKWVTVDGKRLIVLEGGYKEYRSLVGRQNKFVDLFLSGDLFRAITAGRVQNGAAVGTNSDPNYEKALDNEKRYGKQIFVPTEKDINDAQEYVTQEVERIVDGRTS